MVKKSSKSSENKCTHCAMLLVLIGKHAHRKGNFRHVRYCSKDISLQLLIFYIKNSKTRKR